MKNNLSISFSFLLLFLSFSFDATSQTEPRLVLPIGHTDFINSAVFSPDSKLVLTASDDKTAKIYEASTGKELQVLSGHLERINSAIFSPDNKLALTASDDGTAKLFEVISGRELRSFSGHRHFVNSAVFSSNGKLVLTASWDSTARIFDLNTGKEKFLLNSYNSSVSQARFSLDSKLALTLSFDGTVRIFDATTGKEIQSFTNGLQSTKSAIFSPNNNSILILSDSTIGIYDISTGKTLKKINKYAFTEYFNSAFFNKDGSRLIIASSEAVRIIDLSLGIDSCCLVQNKGYFSSANYSQDGKFIISTSLDSIAIWDAQSFEIIKRDKIEFYVEDVFVNEKYNYILEYNYSEISIRDLNNERSEIIISGSTLDTHLAKLSPDGSSVLSAGDGACVWDFAAGKTTNNYIDKKQYRVHSINYSSDGSLIATRSTDGITRIYDLKGANLPINIFVSFESDFEENIRFTENKNKLLIASADTIVNSNTDSMLFGHLRFSLSLWDTNNGELINILNGPDQLNSFDVNFIGSQILTSFHNGLILIWDCQTGRVILKLKCQNGSYPTCAKFSPDGNFFIVSTSDYLSRIYEVSSGKVIQVLNGHTASITSAIFSPDGALALTAGYDNTARIYEVSTGKELKVLDGHFNGIYQAFFSSDGKMVLTASNDNTISIWEVQTGREIQLDLHNNSSYFPSIFFSQDSRYIITADVGHKTIVFETATGKPLYTRLQLKDNDWLVYDEHYRFDGTLGAIEKLYFTCGLEVIDLAQMKDSLWVPGLVEKIMSGQDILINDKPAPKLSDLNICDLTPVIEPIDQENKKILKYRITPRNGGLGNTEVYINGNLTYTLKPQQLQKVKEDKKEVYYLTLSTDTLQQYLTGKKNDKNPILVKSKVKGSGIYSRGEELELTKTGDEQKPQFYGVFIGVNEYGNPQKTANETRYCNLDYAAKDANDLSLAVEKTAGNLFKSDSHIYRLTGTGNEAPTKENLQRVLAEIGAKSKASDILYIFFAGHGDIKKGKNEEGQEQDQIRFMLMNADKANPFTTSFGVEELTKWCSPQKIKAQKRVFVFDACHSGKIIDQTIAFNGRGDDEGARIRQLDKLKDKNGMMILAAAADDESAYEDETLNQGVLTYHLLQVMKEQGDTSLVVRNWFDETIELVKDYSKANGNKQEPSSFGDGRFEIGNVNQDVREAIKITCPKTRVGACVFVDPTGDAEILYPGLQEKINQQFSGNSRGDLVFSSNTDKAFRATGTYFLNEGKLLIRYKILQGSQQIGDPISIPSKSYTSEDEVVLAITNSIAQEIGNLRLQDEKCSLIKN